jgi:hypothetical protein
MRNEIEEYLTENAKVTVSSDRMCAYISLAPWPEDTEPIVRDITEFLEDQKITTGISKINIDRMIDEKIFYQNVMVAQGVEKQDGEDGWLEYTVDVTDRGTKPKILEDGSVDYRSIGDIEVVEPGTVIAIYHPATYGVNGVTVYGEEMKAKPGKQIPKMQGDGYAVSEDGSTYTTTIRGRVFLKDGKLTVSRVYEVFTDVDYLTGNIDFNGDIVVHGAVAAGMRIRALGNLSITGHVEASELIAGGDIMLKAGMQGAGKGTILAGGNVEGRFFEQAKISALGSVTANSMLNCTVDAGDSISVNGRFGAIIGGYLRALNTVSATMFGNMSNVKTDIAVGVDASITSELAKVDSEIRNIEKDCRKLSEAVEKLDLFLKTQASKEILSKKLTIARMMKEKTEEMEKLKVKREEWMEKIEKSAHSKIIVDKMMHEGTVLHINSASKTIRGESTYNVTWKLIDDEICMISNI